MTVTQARPDVEYHITFLQSPDSESDREEEYDRHETGFTSQIPDSNENGTSWRSAIACLDSGTQRNWFRNSHALMQKKSAARKDSRINIVNIPTLS